MINRLKETFRTRKMRNRLVYGVIWTGIAFLWLGNVYHWDGARGVLILLACVSVVAAGGAAVMAAIRWASMGDDK